jgi:hypothetical protein
VLLDDRQLGKEFPIQKEGRRGRRPGTSPNSLAFNSMVTARLRAVTGSPRGTGEVPAARAGFLGMFDPNKVQKWARVKCDRNARILSRVDSANIAIRVGAVVPPHIGERGCWTPLFRQVRQLVAVVSAVPVQNDADLPPHTP